MIFIFSLYWIRLEGFFVSGYIKKDYLGFELLFYFMFSYFFGWVLFKMYLWWIYEKKYIVWDGKVIWFIESKIWKSCCVGLMY